MNNKQHRHSPKKPMALGIALMICCLCLGGCEMLGLGGSKPRPAPKTRPKVVNKPKKAAPDADAAKNAEKKIAEAAEYQRPEYPNNIRRNPFQPDDEIMAPILGPAEGGDINRPLEPLERFTLAQLELVAIISEVAVPKAMFVDPDGFGHMIKEGDRIGRQNGVIVDIRDNEVDVRETTGEDNESQSRVRTIRLRSGELRSSNSDDLTEAEREALDKLLNSKEGRENLRKRLQKNAPGANAVDGGNGGTLPPRNGGIAPPR